MTIITLSPKGQFTIPVSARKKLPSQKFLFELKENMIILKPVRIEVIQEQNSTDDLSALSALAETSFEFWDNEQDDVYQEYFLKTKKV